MVFFIILHHLILLKALLCFLELNTLDACWIAVDEWSNSSCQCQNRWISGRWSRTVRLRLMVTGGGGHNIYPGSGLLDGGNTILPA